MVVEPLQEKYVFGSFYMNVGSNALALNPQPPVKTWVHFAMRVDVGLSPHAKVSMNGHPVVDSDFDAGTDVTKNVFVDFAASGSNVGECNLDYDNVTVDVE